MPILQNTHIVGSRIGKWKATQTPDGVILWVKGEPSFLDKMMQVPIIKNKAAIMATPHYDCENKVAVDLYPDMSMDTDTDTLQGSFWLPGKTLNEDKAIYLGQIKKYIAILK